MCIAAIDSVASASMAGTVTHFAAHTVPQAYPTQPPSSPHNNHRNLEAQVYSGAGAFLDINVAQSLRLTGILLKTLPQPQCEL